MRFKSFKILRRPLVKPAKRPGSDDGSIDPMEGLEDHMSHKKRDLEKAEKQLRELASMAKGLDDNAEPVIRPHGPIGELTLDANGEAVIEPELELVVQKVSAGSPSEKTEENVKMVEAKLQAAAQALAKAPLAATAAPETAPSPAKAPEKKAEPAKAEDDSLRNLFSQDEDEVNPLASLINSLPDVNTQELLDDLQEIKEIMKETNKGH